MTTRVMVIGGGIIGLSIAWRAAEHGFTVTVTDPSPGHGAAHAAVGILCPVSDTAYAEQQLVQLSLASLHRYPAFTRDLTSATGEPTGFRDAGTLHVGYGPDDMDAIAELHASQEAGGITSERLSADQCHALEPALGDSLCGGLLVHDDGAVEPRLLSRALLIAAQSAGVQVIRQEAAEILRTGGRATGARLADGGTVHADWVVLAGGWSSGSIRGLPDPAVPPLRPVKGQILLLHPRRDGAPVVSRTVRGIVGGDSVWLVPRQNGDLVVGSTQEDRGPDVAVTAGGILELLRNAPALLPEIADMQFAEAAAGLRPAAPDKAPLLGPSGLPGLVFATGHFRHGVLLAPVTADAIVSYLADGALPAVAAPFTIERFLQLTAEKTA